MCSWSAKRPSIPRKAPEARVGGGRPSSRPARPIRAFQSAQPRARAQVADPDRQRCGRLPGSGREHRPRDHQVAGRVTDPGGPEVDDGGQCPSRTSRLPPATSPWNHTGGRCQVAASRPPRPRQPGRCRCDRPARPGRRGSPRRSVQARRPGRSCAHPPVGHPRVDGRRARMNVGHRHGKPGRVGDQVRSRRLAVQPAADRPVEGVSLARYSLGQRHRNGNGQRRREDRQPAVFLGDRRA